MSPAGTTVAPTRPYAGATVGFATAHRKEELAAVCFAEILGATVIAPAGLDTDQFGTFSGEIPRTLTPLDAARAKATLAADTLGTPYALASEGSFTTDFGVLVQHRELLLFTDRQRGIELIESHTDISPLRPGTTITTLDHAERHAATVGFPQQGLIVRAGPIIHKELRTTDALTALVTEALQRGDPVRIEPDLRAHRCPTRAEVIVTLCERMAHRLATGCPNCGTPGYGRVNIERGVPCRLCDTPTDLIAADILGCGACHHTERRPRNTQTVDPAQCGQCNP